MSFGFRSLSLAVLMLLVPLAARAGSVGVFGGLNRSSLAGDAPHNTSYGSNFGGIAGLRGEIPIAKGVALGIEPMFVQRGAGISYAAEGGDEPIDSLDVGLDYVAIPVVLRIYTGGGRTYVTGGLDVAFLSSATLSGRGPDEDVTARFRDTDLGALFGFGMLFPIGKPQLHVEARYVQGIFNLSGEDDASDDAGLPDRFRSSGFQFTAGISLPFGEAP